MFPFRPSRAAAALLELADAMLAPQAPQQPGHGDDEADLGAYRLATHPHRRAAAIERRRRPAPARPLQPCVSAVGRTTRPSDAPRSADTSNRV
jgi:hypothetical protein